jgi:hypothetical protein
MAKRRWWRGAGSRGGGTAAREAGAAGRREAALEVGEEADGWVPPVSCCERGRGNWAARKGDRPGEAIWASGEKKKRRKGMRWAGDGFGLDRFPSFFSSSFFSNPFQIYFKPF